MTTLAELKQRYLELQQQTRDFVAELSPLLREKTISLGDGYTVYVPFLFYHEEGLGFTIATENFGYKGSIDLLKIVEVLD